MIGGLLLEATPDAELVEPCSTVLLYNRIDRLNELCSFYFDTVLISGPVFGAIKTEIRMVRPEFGPISGHNAGPCNLFQ